MPKLKNSSEPSSTSTVLMNAFMENVTRKFRNSQYTSKYICRSRAHERGLAPICLQFLKFLEGGEKEWKQGRSSSCK
jgi:hypothetical protein